jgi:hypothetical protein
MATWPTSLPCPMVDGITYAPQDNVIRSDFLGGQKARRRFTRANEDVTFRLALSMSQAQTLHDFCAITCADVLPFQWVEWRDPARRPATYVFKARPTFTAAGSGWAWYADVQLELRTPMNGQFAITNEGGSWLLDNETEGLTT